MGGGLVADDVETGPAEFDWKHERTLVLVGRTGNGKSATGNSILGETKFLSQASAKSITKECKLHRSELPNGLSVNVIDTPGFFSACSTKEFTSREIVSCLSLARDGIDVVLLVLISAEQTLEDYLQDSHKFQKLQEKMNDIQKLSADEIKKLREQLHKAVEETNDLRAKLNNKRMHYSLIIQKIVE